ncbi:hypothetical protein HAP94_07195 [Acidithiobacillus ferrivorans]|nr:hypothetical protein [Acidithiobacillus ferrivorans]
MPNAHWPQRFYGWLQHQPAPIRWLATGPLLEQYLSWEFLSVCMIGISVLPETLISQKDGTLHFAAGIFFITFFPAASLWAIYFGALTIKEVAKKW